MPQFFFSNFLAHVSLFLGIHRSNFLWMIVQPILLAEDSENDAILFQHQLKQARILNPLHVVTDGAQVIDYLDGKGKYSDRSLHPLPVVLFLDLRMPKIGGYQILSFLQASHIHRGLPVIVLSVWGEMKDVGEAYQRGAKSFLIKPLEAADLVHTLRGIHPLRLKGVEGGFILERTDMPLGAVDPKATACSPPQQPEL